MSVIDSPEFGHAFVPIDSLTGSPRSSTESTSVLEWNSNSGSDFSVRSLDHQQYVQSSPPTPDFPTFSPNPSSPKTSLPDQDQILASFNSAPPITDSVTTTVVTNDTSVDEYHNLLSALEERLTLHDSVTQWQNHSYRQSAGLDRPDTPLDVKRMDHAVHDIPPHKKAASSPNCSLVTDSSFSAVTAKPSVHVSSLFLPPAPPTPPTPLTPQVYSVSASPSVMSNHGQMEGISIAQYFQLKAAKAEEPKPVQPPVDGPLRPISAASCLSYASSVRSLRSPRSPRSPVVVPPVRGLRSPPSTVSQADNNNPDSHFNPFNFSVAPPSSQAADTLECNLKSYAPSWPRWPTPPTIPCQFEPVALKPIKPITPNSPRVSHAYGFLQGKIPGKSTSRPVPPPPRASTSPGPVFNWRGPDFSRPSPWSLEPRLRNMGHASPGSTDSVLLPPSSAPSPSSPTRPRSPRSPISTSAVPPSPPPVEIQPPYFRYDTPSNALYVPYVPPTPSLASPVNEAYISTRTPRALPIPSIPRTFGSHSQTAYNTPRYTGSTLPRDMHLSAAPPTPWGPTPRRLRFAPLPPTPSAGLPYTTAPSYSQPYTAPSYATPLPPYPLYPMPYPYNAPAPGPQIPAPYTPYSSWPSGHNNCSPPLTPHPVFWYSDGSIVFRIENVGYKVHRHLFERHSAYFRDLLAYPAYAVTSSVPHNIYLADVKKVDFERLLLIFYPSNLVDTELFTVEEWTSILILSDKWNFAQLKTIAIRELGFITSTIEKIALSKKYTIGNPQWLLAAYRELCTRHYPLSLVEGEKLGLETVIKIWEVQHELMMAWGRSADIVIQEKFGLF